MSGSIVDGGGIWDVAGDVVDFIKEIPGFIRQAGDTLEDVIAGGEQAVGEQAQDFSRELGFGFTISDVVVFAILAAGVTWLITSK